MPLCAAGVRFRESNMTTVREPRLTPVAILNLRPTQFTVGMREVKAKRKRWRDERTKKGEEFLGKHMIPVILGPKDRHYVIDHHHLARALHDEGVKDVAVTVIKNLSTLDRDSFWFVIVDELIYRLRQVVERSTTAFHKRMRPIVFLQILYARCLGNRLAAPVNVRFGSLTDIAQCRADFRFASNSRHHSGGLQISLAGLADKTL